MVDKLLMLLWTELQISWNSEDNLEHNFSSCLLKYRRAIALPTGVDTNVCGVSTKLNIFTLRFLCDEQSCDRWSILNKDRPCPILNVSIGCDPSSDSLTILTRGHIISFYEKLRQNITITTYLSEILQNSHLLIFRILAYPEICNYKNSEQTCILLWSTCSL